VFFYFVNIISPTSHLLFGLSAVKSLESQADTCYLLVVFIFASALSDVLSASQRIYI
jgi:hypothetical protein